VYSRACARFSSGRNVIAIALSSSHMERPRRHRSHRSLSITVILEKLNADLDAYPPPQSPNPKRRTGMWGRSSVWEILHNPKYTGFMV
jgi:hypothetical protein